MKAGEKIYKQKVVPSMNIGEKVGNIYTGSLYAGLISLISDPKIELEVTKKFIIINNMNTIICIKENKL